MQSHPSGTGTLSAVARLRVALKPKQLHTTFVKNLSVVLQQGHSSENNMSQVSSRAGAELLDDHHAGGGKEVPAGGAHRHGDGQDGGGSGQQHRDTARRDQT